MEVQELSAALEEVRDQAEVGLGMEEPSSTSSAVTADTTALGQRDEVQLLLEAFDATRHASRLWVRLLKPYFSWIFRSAYRSVHSSFDYAKQKFLELDEETQKTISLSLAALLGLFALKRLVERSKIYLTLRRKYNHYMNRVRIEWQQFNQRIGKTSTLLAKLLPHLLLLVLYCVYLFLMPHSIRGTLESSLVYLILSKVYPIVWSTDACLRGLGKGQSLDRYLQLWISFYIYEVMEEIPLLVPLLSPIMRYVAYDMLMATRLFFALWLVLPITNGAGLLCSALSQATHSRRSKYSASKEKKGALAGWFLDSASRLGLISVPHGLRAFATDLVNHWVHLLSLPFVFTPGFITYYGGILSGKIFPIRASLRAQASKEADEVKHWTVYWTVFSSLDCVHYVVSMVIGWIPLWQHMKLMGIFWLQFPYFHGANSLFASLDEEVALKVCSYFKTSIALPKLKTRQSRKQLSNTTTTSSTTPPSPRRSPRSPRSARKKQTRDELKED